MLQRPAGLKPFDVSGGLPHRRGIRHLSENLRRRENLCHQILRSLERRPF